VLLLGVAFGLPLLPGLLFPDPAVPGVPAPLVPVVPGAAPTPLAPVEPEPPPAAPLPLEAAPPAPPAPPPPAPPAPPPAPPPPPAAKADVIAPAKMTAAAVAVPIFRLIIIYSPRLPFAGRIHPSRPHSKEKRERQSVVRHAAISCSSCCGSCMAVIRKSRRNCLVETALDEGLPPADGSVGRTTTALRRFLIGAEPAASRLSDSGFSANQSGV
jgi:hypothetical protein